MAVAPVLPGVPWIQGAQFNPPLLPYNFHTNENRNNWNHDHYGNNFLQSWTVPAAQMRQPYQVQAFANGMSQTSTIQMMQSATNQMMQPSTNQMMQSPTNQMMQPPRSTNEMSQRDESDQSELNKSLTQLAMYVIPFFLFPANAAAYFAITDILGTFLTKLGVSDGWSLIILIFVQCVDVVALSRGRFKFVEGWESNYYSEIWDTIAGSVGLSEIIRIGSQYLFPASGLPTYEQ